MCGLSRTRGFVSESLSPSALCAESPLSGRAASYAPLVRHLSGALSLSFGLSIISADTPVAGGGGGGGGRFPAPRLPLSPANSTLARVMDQATLNSIPSSAPDPIR